MFSSSFFCKPTGYPPIKCCASPENPYLILNIPRRASKDQIREAYLARIRLIHPDVNQADTTQQAAKLNAAYEALIRPASNKYEEGDISQDADEDMKDVFDVSDGPAENLFVNPFGCYGVNPFMWRELQETACRGENPEEELEQAGIGVSDNTVHYLTKDQFVTLTEELKRMEATMAVDASQYYIQNCLNRAARVNRR